MKTDSDAIDKQRLLRALHDEYGVRAPALTFLPRGEDAFTYHAPGASGSYFVRLQPARAAIDLKRVYPILARLHGTSLPEALAPIETRHGRTSLVFDGFVVAVFPFIDGETLYRRATTAADIRAAAALIARLHGTPSVWQLPREQFNNPFEQPIRRALAVEPSADMSALQLEAVRLLAQERDDILASIELMDRLGQAARLLTGDWVLSHGDPNLDNFLEDRHGVLHLTDWGELAIGPPERDLNFFTGDLFEHALRQYVEGRPLRALHGDVFAFYQYRWSMQEIADYSTRLLFHDRGAVESEHAWAELQDYLPLRHASIAEGLAQTKDVVEAVVDR